MVSQCDQNTLVLFVSLFAEEVILSEEKTSTEEKIKIIEGSNSTLLDMYRNAILLSESEYYV